MCPVAARRAAAILGETAALDAVDRSVLAALRVHRGVAPAASLRRIWTTAPAHTTPTWGLADDGHQIWFQDGTRVSLVDRPQLWAILVCLYEHGGEATKEQLVCQIWSLNDYHPLRHDNRLHVAIRKLRVLIEEDPARPRRLVTTADGYALVGTVRRARVS